MAAGGFVNGIFLFLFSRKNLGIQLTSRRFIVYNKALHVSRRWFGLLLLCARTLLSRVFRKGSVTEGKAEKKNMTEPPPPLIARTLHIRPLEKLGLLSFYASLCTLLFLLSLLL